MKVVINNRYGGFGLSEEAEQLYLQYEGLDTDAIHVNSRGLKRNDLTLVRVVKELGDKANGSFAELKIVEIPDDVDWEIEEYDGSEWVREVSRRWD
jgi:hypothetical protein